jgi:hypothetical protein
MPHDDDPEAHVRRRVRRKLRFYRDVTSFVVACPPSGLRLWGWRRRLGDVDLDRNAIKKSS